MLTERVVNIIAGAVSAALILLYIDYAVFGPPYGITFAFPALLAIASTYTMLAVHQTFVAAYDCGRPRPFVRPVPFGWVLASVYISFTVLLWWVMVDYFWNTPFQPELRRFIWLQAALTHVWFFRRFLFWSLPPETHNQRDKRQQATQDVLDETSLVLAKRGKRLSDAGIRLDERIIQMGEDQQAFNEDDAAQDRRDVAQDERDAKGPTL
jgi:hypothetical protein